MLEVLPLALASAVDPVLIASVAVMLSRRRAASLLVAYLVAGAAVSVGAGVLILFALGKAGLGGGTGAAESPGIDVGAGAALLIVAVVIATGVGRRVVAIASVRRRDVRGSAPGAAPVRAEKPSLRDRVRAAESPWIAALAGVAWGVPGAFYLAALALIARSGVATASAVVTIVAFNLVMFALVELPLLAFFIAPGRTRAAVQRISAVASTHRRTLAAGISGAAGTYLLGRGFGLF
jgi:Sap, sulfolipid-1-addressing protein